MNKDAAKCLKCIRHYMEGEECLTDAEFESMDMAIKAIEKDIPKKPTQHIYLIA